MKKLRRMDVLAKLINKNEWTTGAEIGVFKGATFFHLLDQCPQLRLIGVDSWRSPPQQHEKNVMKGLSTWHSQARYDEWADSVKLRARQYPNATLYHADSLRVAEQIPDGSLDFIFVDAEHTTEAVIADVTAWRGKVRAGGWILGHDEEWPSVQRALKHLFPSWTKHDDNVWSVPT